MLELLLLGPPQIADDTGPLTGPAVQRRRIAILALLGCAPGNVLSRDKLIAYLWPECRTDIARHRLSVALHELRRALGDAAVVSRGDDVCLDTGVIRVDVAEFEFRRNAADWTGAANLYRGPFLDGFFLDDSAEFERWADAAREQYARAYADALERLADACARAGDHAAEIEARRRLVAHDPFSSQAALDLIRTLNESGDRSGALQHARMHTVRLREEFEAEPDAGFTEYVARMREAGASLKPRPQPAIPPQATPQIAIPARRPVRVAIVAAVLPLLALGGWTAWSTLASESAPVTRVAVLPFEVSGDSDLEFLRDGMVDLLSTNLNGAGDVRTIDPHALFDALADEKTLGGRIRAVQQNLGATSYITGTIYVAGENLRVNASMYAMDSPRAISTATVDGSPHDIFAIVDEVSRQLIGNALTMPGDRPVRIAAATTRSIPALKAYLAGERAFRVGRFVSAIDDFTRAVALDSTFAIANYRLALSMLWADVPDTLPFVPEARALRYSADLPAHDQQLIRAFVAWRAGDSDEAERIYRSIVRMYPDDSEAWHQLGETLYHYNPLSGRDPAEADKAFERAAALDPESWAAHWHRALIAGATGNTERFRAQVAHLRTMGPEPAQLLELDAVDAYTRDDRVAISNVLPRLERAAPLQLFQIAWRVATLAHNLDAAEQIVRLALAQHNTDGVLHGNLALASLAAARGDRAAVNAALDAMARYDGNGRASRLNRAAFALHPMLPHTNAELERYLADVLAMEPVKPGEALTRLYMAGLLAARLGKTEDLRRYADEFEAIVQHVERPHSHAGSLAGLRARIALLEGRPTEALARLGAARNQVWFGWSIGSSYWSQAPDRYLRAELLRQEGRFEEAARWYKSLEQFSLTDLAYLGPARARRAEMAPLMTPDQRRP